MIKKLQLLFVAVYMVSVYSFGQVPIPIESDDGMFFMSTEYPATLSNEALALIVMCNPPGTPCNDSNPATLIDVEDGNCNCIGETIERGPYLQSATDSSMVIRWRSLLQTDSEVKYGIHPDSLSQSAYVDTATYDHEVQITGLSAATVYYYSIGNGSAQFIGGDSSHFFKTSPVPGTEPPLRFWVLGDCGTADSNAEAVRDAYYSYADSNHTDGIIMLGDNAYNSGTDSEYQDAVFEMYDALLKQSAIWPTPGNHDYGSGANATNQSGPYYDIFTLPKVGEAGGLASGTEAYYSFDVGNVHFISLDSHDSDREPGGDMLTWLANDLGSTLQEWIIAFWHHPAYTKGSHDSDSQSDSGGRMIDMRENVLPILEAHNVDLIMSGHSHSYERSFFIDGHYGPSSSFDTLTMLIDGGDGRLDGDGAYSKNIETGDGMVYITAGSSGKISGGLLNHPVMFFNANTLGSLSIEVEKDQLDIKFIDNNGEVDDYLTIRHADYNGAAPTVQITHPLDNAFYGAPELVTIAAAAQDSDGVVQYVEFFVNSVSIGVDSFAPYQSDWLIPADGSYRISANAVDDSMNIVPSANRTVLVGSITASTKVSGSTQDAEEKVSNGSVNITSSDLELCREGSAPQIIGIRFNNPGIPRSSEITNAYIQFTVDETNNANPCNISIWGEVSENPASYTTATNNISSRTKTSAVVGWSPPNWVNVNDDGAAQATPDLKSILQEILSQHGYTANSGIAFILEGTGRRTAESFNGDSDEAPELFIEYRPCPEAGIACDDGDPNTFNDREDGFCNCRGSAKVGSAVIPISAGIDDVEQDGFDASIYDYSSDIELVNDGDRGDQVVGLRFRDIYIPQNSFISAAHIQFTVDNVDSLTNTVFINAEAEDNSLQFALTTNNVSNRTPTEKTQRWTIPEWLTIGASGSDQSTPELRALVQEVISRPGWSAGNALTFMINGTGVKTAESFEGSPSQAAKLYVEWDSICRLEHIVYVDSAANGKKTGASWTDAFTLLEDALALAAECSEIDEIWVKTGTYRPTAGIDRTKSFVLPGKTRIYGGFAGGETLLNQRNVQLNTTTLSGDIGVAQSSSDNSYHVISINHADSCLLDGFVLEGGNADGAGMNESVGGGVLLTSGVAFLQNLTIADCRASIAGEAIYIKGSDAQCILEGVNISPVNNSVTEIQNDNDGHLILKGNNNIKQ